jgi:tetratricopeptide (TPR) repeat protein
VLDALDAATGVQLIAEVQGAKRPTYTFTHALVRQTLYEELSMARRQRLHLACAESLQTVHVPDIDSVVADIARHLRAAGTGAPLDKALDFSVRAANRAAAVFGWEEAIDHLESVLELIDETTEPEQMARVLSRLGDLTYVSSVHIEQGTEALERALAIYERLGMRGQTARMHSRIGRGFSSYAWHMNIPKALEHFRAAADLMSDTEEAPALGLVYIGLAAAGIYGLEHKEAIAASARAIEIAERIGSDGLRVNAFALHGYLLCHTGELDQGTAELDSAWENAQRLGLGTVSFFAALNRGVVSSGLRDYVEATRWWEREAAEPFLAQAPTLRQQLHLNLIRSLVRAGDLDGARRYAVESLAAGGNISSGGTVVDWAAGQWDTVEQIEREFLEQTRRSGNRLFEVARLANLASHANFRGDYLSALDLIEQGLAISSGAASLIHELNFLAESAILLAEHDRLDEAGARMQRARELASGRDVKGIEGTLVLGEAMLAANSASRIDKDEAFARAIAIFRRYPEPWSEAEALRLWGQALLRAGETSKATEKFDAAVDIYRRIGAGQPFVDRVIALRPS